MIRQQDLAQHLARRVSGAWSLVERIQDLASAADSPGRQRRERRTRLSLIVHQDTPRGRGSARLDIDPYDGSPGDLVDQAVALALGAVGPAWASALPAAPAKVALADPALVDRELAPIAAGTLSRLRRPESVTTTAAIHVLREKVTLVSSAGFHTSWLATTVRGDALLAAGDHSLAVSRHARRVDAFDADLDAALADAASDLRLLGDATAPSPGPCALWLGPDALLPAPIHFDGDTLLDGDAHGLWAIFAHQADATVERQGLTRYRLRAEVARGASQLAEPLTISSDGALDFAALSIPVTDDAVAIRRFPVIDRGVAVGLGLSPREAALRGTDPNGGVRNLVVAPGTWSPAPSPTIRTLELRRLHAVTLDPHTGDASLDIALALDHRPGRAPVPITGGTVHLDLIAALARARRSADLLLRSAYHGPAAVLIDDAHLLA